MILLIESSAEYPSVALVTEAGVLAHLEVGKEVQSHAELLPMMVQRAVELSNSEFGIFTKGISAVGFHEGPGSYTGLRIGVSLAKGLCFAKGIPLISVSGFEALGAEILRSNESTDSVWVMMDARRDEVYAIKLERISVKDSGSDYQVSLPICAMILPDDRVGEPDEKGNLWLRLPHEVDGFTSLQRQRKVSQSLDEGTATELLKEKGLFDRCFVMMPVLKEDEVMACLYEGLITEEEVDKMFPKKVSYAFLTSKA